MKKVNAEAMGLETESALDRIQQLRAGHKYPACIGPDVHKDSIVVAVARTGRQTPDTIRAAASLSLERAIYPVQHLGGEADKKGRRTKVAKRPSRIRFVSSAACMGAQPAFSLP